MAKARLNVLRYRWYVVRTSVLLYSKCTWVLGTYRVGPLPVLACVLWVPIRVSWYQLVAAHFVASSVHLLATRSLAVSGPHLNY